MSWRDRVDKALSDKNTRNDRNTRPQFEASVANVPTVPAIAPNNALRQWRGGLASLDPERAPDGFGAKDWWQLWLDACWLFEQHGRFCALNGWTAQSLFGVDVDNPPAGGLAQLLQSSRSVVFDGPRAKVRKYGVTFDRNAAWAAACPLIWEI